MLSNGRERVWEVILTVSFRGSKSRNKVSVGEPAEGSLPIGFSAFLCAPFSSPAERVSSGWGFARLSANGVGGNQSWAPSPPSPRTPFFSQNTLKFFSLCDENEKFTTSNGGPLGSCIDEERSKLRYVV